MRLFCARHLVLCLSPASAQYVIILYRLFLYLSHANLVLDNCTFLHRAVLVFLNTMLGKRSTQAHCLSTAHTDELAKLFVAAVRHMKTRELKETAAELLKQFIDVHNKQLNMETLLEEAGECEHLRPLRQQLINDPKLPKVGELGPVDYIRAFLKPNRIDRLHGLREYVSNGDRKCSNCFIIGILLCAACRA